jgi:hypothetical protein
MNMKRMDYNEGNESVKRESADGQRIEQNRVEEKKKILLLFPEYLHCFKKSASDNRKINTF